MKLCRTCKTPFLPKNYQIKRGDYSCRPCLRASGREWRARRKAAGNPVRTAQMPKSWQQEYGKKYSAIPENKARRAKRAKARYRGDPVYRERNRVRRLARNAIRLGILVCEPCRVCGIEKVQAHHPDYTKPLTVQWLCTKHHAALHSQVGET